MSGEFRWANDGYLHRVLENVDADGEEQLSTVLGKLYRELAPLERACAYVEAGDSSKEEIMMSLFEHRKAVRDAMASLEQLIRENETLIEAVIRRMKP